MHTDADTHMNVYYAYISKPHEGSQEDGPGVRAAHIQHVVLAHSEGIAAWETDSCSYTSIDAPSS